MNNGNAPINIEVLNNTKNRNLTDTAEQLLADEQSIRAGCGDSEPNNPKTISEISGTNQDNTPEISHRLTNEPDTEKQL